jgi:SAM-dependent methyltransferase
VALEPDTFFREYTSQDATLKYTSATAGFGISYLLDHDYQTVYLEALDLLPLEVRQRGIRLLEFGCGAGMNLLHVVSVLAREGIKLSQAIGTDLSQVMIEAARREAKNCLGHDEQSRVEFYVAKSETLIEDLSSAWGKSRPELEASFDFVIGVNTIRYCHRAKKEMQCAQAIFDLLAPRGICVVIDMNDRFPLFRSALKNRLRGEGQNKPEYYLPSLDEYARPFAQTGFEVLRKEHFCWIPHSSGPVLCRILSALSPMLDTLGRSRAMRSLVLARKSAPEAVEKTAPVRN